LTTLHLQWIWTLLILLFVP